MNIQENSGINPIKRRGVTIHVISIIAIVALLFFFLMQLNRLVIGPLFVFFLLSYVLLFLLLIFFSYRLYSLSVAKYEISREGIFLKWGFREQLIPMEEVLWVRVEGDLTSPLEFPNLSWMGSTQGVFEQKELGNFEFMFSSLETITIVGTNEKNYIISPENQNLFLQQFQRAIEFGTLGTIQGRSVFPNFLLVEIWKLPSARNLLFPAIIFSISLIVFVGLAIPNYSQVSLGFSTVRLPLDPVPAIQLILLPIINFTLLLVNLWIATFFYRREERNPVITFLFASSALSGFIFLVALFEILNIS